MSLQAISDFFLRIPTDWIVLFAVAVFVAFDVLRSGTSRAVALAFALPLATILSQSITGSKFLGPVTAQFSSPLLQAALFLIILIALFILVNRITSRFGEGSSQPIQALLSGLAVAAIGAVIWTQVPALDSIWHFGQTTQLIFGEAYRFWWLIVAYIALAFVRN